jgi:hypothetical protein
MRNILSTMSGLITLCSMFKLTDFLDWVPGFWVDADTALCEAVTLYNHKSWKWWRQSKKRGSCPTAIYLCNTCLHKKFIKYFILGTCFVCNFWGTRELLSPSLEWSWILWPLQFVSKFMSAGFQFGGVGNTWISGSETD